jgi:hypothetical protein
MSTRARRVVGAVVVGAVSAAVVLLLGGHFQARGVAAALIIGAGAGLSSLSRRQGCRR